ncbi:MAG TPA: bestrophin family ion channel [Haliangium sp.]|nr:bestrophin family ion channel [Haliangium sp.]
MIVPENRTWIRIVFYVTGTLMRRVWLRLAIITTVAVAVTVVHDIYHLFDTSLTPTPFTLVGLALSIFLGFRNNTSYDRYWEGRKLWGALVNTARTAARQSVTLLGPLPDAAPPASADAEAKVTSRRREIVHAVIAYVHALRMHLRDIDDVEALRPFLDPALLAMLPAEHNRPYAILRYLGQLVRSAWTDGLVHTVHLPALDATLVALADIQGGCERIKNTPIPFPYTVIIHRIVAVYCMAMPFGLVDTIGPLTPLVVIFVAYTFFGLDALGDEIEDPFGTDPSDLPLDTLCRTIEINLRQALGETELPPALQPVDDVLL